MVSRTVSHMVAERRRYCSQSRTRDTEQPNAPLAPHPAISSAPRLEKHRFRRASSSPGRISSRPSANGCS